MKPRRKIMVSLIILFLMVSVGFMEVSHTNASWSKKITVSGVVTDLEDKPLRHATMIFKIYSFTTREGSYLKTVTTTTDDFGQYSFTTYVYTTAPKVSIHARIDDNDGFAFNYWDHLIMYVNSFAYWEIDNVPYAARPWWNDVHDVDRVHAKGYFGENTVVVVIDTGFVDDYQNIFPENSILTQYSKSFSVVGKKWDNSSDPHGTEVTSVILGYKVPGSWDYTNDYVIGIAPKAKVIMLQVDTYQGNNQLLSELIDAIYYARRLHKIDIPQYRMVISLSVGWYVESESIDPIDSETEERLMWHLNMAVKEGIPISAAAGNVVWGGSSYWNQVTKTARYNATTAVSGVIYEGMTDVDQTNLLTNIPEEDPLPKLSFAEKTRQSSTGTYQYWGSCQGPQINITAIFQGFYLPVGDNQYVSATGTSYGTPIISGIYSLMFSKYGNTPVSTLNNYLFNSALTNSNNDPNKWGNGFAQADGALGI